MLALHISQAETIVEMLNLLAGKCLTLPICTVLDNARYQHCKLVMEVAAKLGIELAFLPPYSPNHPDSYRDD